MSFFKKLFGRQHPDLDAYFKAMEEMASESERTYRGMVNIYNESLHSPGFSDRPRTPVEPAGRGLYKARLFGALFIVYAYSKADAGDQQLNQFTNAATGLALMTADDPNKLHLDREEATSFTIEWLKSTYVAILNAFDAGPMVPNALREEHVALTDRLHDALSDSIRSELYTQPVRKRLEHFVQMNTAMAMNQARRWIF